MTDDFTQSPEFQALIKEYLEYLKGLLPEVREKLADSSYDDVYKYAHNIKGTGTSYGFVELTGLGAEICQEIKAENYALLSEKLDSIEALLDSELETR